MVEPDPKGKMPKEIKIPIPDLNFNPMKQDALNLFILYTNIVMDHDSFNSLPFYEIFPFWYALYDKNDPLGIRINPVKIEKKSSSLMVVSNPRAIQVEIVVEAKAQLSQEVLISCSSQENFEYCDVLQPSDLPKTLTINSLNFFISITGDRDANIDMLSIREVGNASSRSCSKEEIVRPNEVHDAFVNDMKSFVFDWKPENTAELVMNFPCNLYELSDFSLLLYGCIQSPLAVQFPLRVVLLYAIFIHRFNYIVSKFKRDIPNAALNRVRTFISCESSMKDFINDIAKSDCSGPFISVNRHEAHRIILDGRGDVKKTIIAQFAKRISTEDINNMRATEYPWRVSFEGESAIDAGGPRRELFTEISSSIFQPTSQLFILSPNGINHCGSFRDVYVPSQAQPNREISGYYEAIGTFLGVVMRNGFPQNLPFAPFIWKFLAGEVIAEKDIVMIDSRLGDLFKNIRKAKDDQDFVQRFNLRWSFISWNSTIVTPSEYSNRGYVQGSQVEEFIDAAVQFRINEIKSALTKIREGFYLNIGFEHHALMSASLLSLLAQGTNIITTSQLKNITTFAGFDPKSKAISNYWSAVEMMTNDQRSKLLKFITTLTRLPNSQVNTEFTITISKMSEGDDSRLPGASTCFNKMYLPSYSTPEIAFQKIVYAIEVCDTMENS
jgi:hypothetical protein